MAAAVASLRADGPTSAGCLVHANAGQAGTAAMTANMSPTNAALRTNAAAPSALETKATYPPPAKPSSQSQGHVPPPAQQQQQQSQQAPVRKVR